MGMECRPLGCCNRSPASGRGVGTLWWGGTVTTWGGFQGGGVGTWGAYPHNHFWGVISYSVLSFQAQHPRLSGSSRNFSVFWDF